MLLVVLFSVVALVLLVPQPGSPGVAGASAPASSVDQRLVAAERATPYADVEVIARFVEGTRRSTIDALVHAAGGEVTHDLHLIGGVGISIKPGEALLLADDPRVSRLSLSAPIASRSFDLDRLRSVYPRAVGSTRLWNLLTGGLTGSGVGVAVVDTGIAGRLPDFQVSRLNRSSRVRNTVVVNPRATSAEDEYGHGTHVAGIIAGDGSSRRFDDSNRGRYIGVAPDARLTSIKISDAQGRATTLDAIYGIQFAVDHHTTLDIDVINLSLSSSEPESPATDPLAAAAEAAWLSGIVVVAAAGNDGDAPDAVGYAPGNSPYVITVGATDDQGTEPLDDDTVAEWSSRGVTQTGVAKPEILAPGAHIVSTLSPDSAFASLCEDCITDRSYFQAGGTSMATAVVSGAVALILDRHPDWTPDQVKAALVSTGQNMPGVAPKMRVDRAVNASPDPVGSKQTWPVSQVINPVTGAIDYDAAKWRAARWRKVESDDPFRAPWSSSSYGCDCSMTDFGEVDPQAARWRAASWRTSFRK